MKPLLPMAALPLLVAVGGGYEYVVGGRYVSTDNAYVQQDKVTISPDVSGRIVEVAVRENQPVHRGDLLFRIDDEPYRLALQQADAALASARLKVEQLRADLGEAQAKQAAAEEKVSFEQREFQRQQDLLKTGVAARATRGSGRGQSSAPLPSCRIFRRTRCCSAGLRSPSSSNSCRVRSWRSRRCGMVDGVRAAGASSLLPSLPVLLPASPRVPPSPSSRRNSPGAGAGPA